MRLVVVFHRRGSTSGTFKHLAYAAREAELENQKREDMPQKGQSFYSQLQGNG
jgi:hypothetical protein